MRASAGGSRLDDPPRQLVGVDVHRPVCGETLGDERLPRRDASGEPDQIHALMLSVCLQRGRRNRARPEPLSDSGRARW